MALQERKNSMYSGNIEKDFEKYLVDTKLWTPWKESNHTWIQRIADLVDKAAKRTAEENAKLTEDDYRWWVELVKLQRHYGDERDLFGEYLELKNMTSQKNGQFFTPMSICKMMSMMVQEDSLERSEPITVSDCTCGSGRMMIAHALNASETDAHYHPAKYKYYNQDIDHKSFVFTTLNAALRNLWSVNVWGDTLAVKEYKTYITIPTNLGMAVWLDREHELSKLEKTSEEVKAAS